MTCLRDGINSSIGRKVDFILAKIYLIHAFLCFKSVGVVVFGDDFHEKLKFDGFEIL